MPGEDKNQLFITSEMNVIETAKEYQFALSFEPFDERPRKAAEAIEIIGDPRELVGGRRIIVHSLVAYVLHDGLSQDAEIYHDTQLSDVVLQSEFSRLAFVNHRRLSAFCLYLFNNHVVSSREKIFDTERIQSGVFVPVHEVESVWAA